MDGGKTGSSLTHLLLPPLSLLFVIQLFSTGRASVPPSIGKIIFLIPSPAISEKYSDPRVTHRRQATVGPYRSDLQNTDHCVPPNGPL